MTAPLARLLVVMLPLLPGTVGCSSPRPDGRFEYTRLVMGVHARLVLYAPDEAVARRAARAAFAETARLNGLLSDYQRDSELMRLCRQAGGEGVPVSADLFYLMERAVELSRASDGAFDVTAGAVVRIWRRARQRGALPSAPSLEQALRRTGWRYVELTATGRLIRLALPEMQLDLGGIAKGYAARRAVEAMTRAGCPRCLAALAGDIAVGAPPPERPGWSIDLEPFGDESPLLLSRAAVSTSGDTEQFLEVDGVRYSHIIDPRTGRALSRRQTATVIAPRGETADALASALCVLTPEGGAALMRRYPAAAAMVTWSEDGRSHRTILNGGRWAEYASAAPDRARRDQVARRIAVSTGS